MSRPSGRVVNRMPPQPYAPSAPAPPTKEPAASAKPVTWPLLEPPPQQPPKLRPRWPFYVGAGLLIYGASAYTFWFWYSFVNPKEKSKGEHIEADQPEVDLSAVYDETAARFDSDVSFVEKTSGLWLLRRKLLKQAKGHVLEVSVGTGMNFKHYELDQCKSITFLDQSGPMLEIAKAKWRSLYPKSAFLDNSPENTKIAFRKQSALDPLEAPKDGYDTIVQTMGACSTMVPSETLSRLGSMLNRRTGKILLIEHGRGYYNWINYILDRDAHRHAEKYGCYHNRDIGEIVEQSGLVVETMRRPYWWNLGTVWVIEARPKGWSKDVS